MSPRRRRIFRALALGLILVVGLVAIGVVMILQGRLIIHPMADWGITSPVQFVRQEYVAEPGYERTGHRYLYDPLLGWRNIPRWHATTFGQPLTINSKGLRGPERTFAKPAGTRRVLVLGDSYAWGYSVGDDAVFSAVLEKMLRGGMEKWEVINTGVSGWGTDQEYLFLKQEGLRYSPDVVVLAFFLLNDPQNNSASRQYGLDKPLFLNRNLELVNVPVPKPSPTNRVMETQAHPAELTLALIERIAQLGRENGWPLVVMKFGQFLEPDNANIALQSRMFAQMVSRLPNVHYLDLDAQFRSRGLGEAQLTDAAIKNDGHWDARGHAVVAEVLKGFLESQGLLAPNGARPTP